MTVRFAPKVRGLAPEAPKSIVPVQDSSAKACAVFQIALQIHNNEMARSAAKKLQHEESTRKTMYCDFGDDYAAKIAKLFPLQAERDHAIAVAGKYPYPTIISLLRKLEIIRIASFDLPIKLQMYEQLRKMELFTCATARSAACSTILVNIKKGDEEGFRKELNSAYCFYEMNVEEFCDILNALVEHQQESLFKVLEEVYPETFLSIPLEERKARIDRLKLIANFS